MSKSIADKIAALKRSLNSPATPENMKAAMRSKLEDYEKQLGNGASGKSPAKKKPAPKAAVVDNDLWYIEYLNKKKGFKPDVKEFDSYEEGLAWGRKNLENFNMDMLRVKVDGKLERKPSKPKTGKMVKVSIKNPNPGQPSASNKQAAELLQEARHKVLDKIGADSGGAVYKSMELQKKFKAAMDAEFKKTGLGKGDINQEVFDILEDENMHIVNNYLALKGYYGQMTKLSYMKDYKEFPANANTHLNPELYGAIHEKVKAKKSPSYNEWMVEDKDGKLHRVYSKSLPKKGQKTFESYHGQLGDQSEPVIVEKVINRVGGKTIKPKPDCDELRKMYDEKRTSFKSSGKKYKKKSPSAQVGSGLGKAVKAAVKAAPADAWKDKDFAKRANKLATDVETAFTDFRLALGDNYDRKAFDKEFADVYKVIDKLKKRYPAE